MRTDGDRWGISSGEPWPCAMARRTVGDVEISGSSAALANLGTGRLQVEVATKVLDVAIDATAQAAGILLESLSRTEPAGLTFSASGLSSGHESRFIADL